MDGLTPYLIFVAGVLVTIVVGRYYFKRTTNKSLGIFRMLVSEAFAGVESEVRERMTFTYLKREVDDITQIEFLVANDGDTAISDLINPLALTLPKSVELLDANILHRDPNDLDVEINLSMLKDDFRSIEFEFPLLNKGEFFLVKLLIAGKIAAKDLQFTLLGNDLPRTLSMSRLPSSAYRERKFRPDWVPFFVGVFMSFLGVWLYWVVSLVVDHQPELFPIPWDTYTFSWQSIALLVPASIALIVIGFSAVSLIILGVFDDLTERGPRFPLPRELRNRHGEFPFIIHAQLESDDLLSNPSNSARTPPSSPVGSSLPENTA